MATPPLGEVAYSGLLNGSFSMGGALAEVS